MSIEIVRRAVPCTPELPALPPLLQRIYGARRVHSAQELEHRLPALPAPDTLTGIGQAVDLLCRALEQQQKIVIVADFDADGATSCTLAVRALRAFGAERVAYVVPDRFKYGYGLTPEIVEVAAEFAPDLLITVDNGISSLDGVAAAQARGIQVLVTDHHLPGAELPAAAAIVNPNQPGDAFPSKNIAGVGVIFYVMLALRRRLSGQGWFARRGLAEPNMAQFLDLVAFGTVADVVVLDHVNRILVEQGVRRIRAGQCSPGILALCEVSGRDYQRLSTTDIGFCLGPRLNAAGRLDNMGFGIECLLSDDLTDARSRAQQLDQLNRERRSIEADMQTQALADLERLHLNGDLPFGLCLYDASWHQGVIGILAARVRERTHRPTIAFAPDHDGQIKGSARSVDGLHIRDALDAVAARHPGLVSKFGGHAMAAGLSLPSAHYADFAQAFDAEVRRHLAPDDLRGVLYSDGELSPDELSLPLAAALREAGPWGQGFPEPLFDGIFEVVTYRVLAEKHLKMTLRPSGSRQLIDAIAFNKHRELGPEPPEQVRIAYRLCVNEFRGKQNPELIVEHIERAN